MFSLKRPPDVVINGNENGEEYLRRWHIIPRNRWLNIYLHHFVGDDPGRDFHDHPWGSLSICLKGRMIESYEPEYSPFYGYDGSKTRVIQPGSIHYRKSTFLHRIDQILKGTWTLFITGPKVREWGFVTFAGRWIKWDIYLDPMRREIWEATMDTAEQMSGDLIEVYFKPTPRSDLSSMKYVTRYQATGENND
jgi:hypothetical protein